MNYYDKLFQLSVWRVEEFLFTSDLPNEIIPKEHIIEFGRIQDQWHDLAKFYWQLAKQDTPEKF